MSFKHKLKYLLATMLPIVSHSLHAYSVSKIEDSTALQNLQEQRKLFLQAEMELKKNKNNGSKILKKFAVSLSNYPLYRYLEYSVIQESIQYLTNDKLKIFLNRYQDTPLAQPLKESWLLYNAKQKKWDNFLNEYQETNNIELECYYIQAKAKYSKNKLNFNEKIKNIWLNGNPQPKSCDVVFEDWKKQGLMTKAMVWQRIKLAIIANKDTFARYLAVHYLPRSEQPIVELWIKVNKNPNFIAKKNAFSGSHPAIPEILIHGILNIAKKDPEKAIEHWYILSKIHSFTERHRNYVVKQIAIALAKALHPDSYAWFKKIPIEYKDQEVYNVQLTLFLKDSKWEEILKTYSELPKEIKEQEKWLYWYARALEMCNQVINSKKILVDLSTKRSYYGFLSSSKLLRPYSFKFKPVSVNSVQMNVLLKNRSIQRAYELLKLDRINQASKEWRFALKTMNEWELHAAAKLADSLSMPNWAIIALSDAKEQDDLSLRFPKHYSQYIINEAKKNKLDPAWVFAITRQESAFRPNVRSYAGALGLMQLMPKTGFMVARTIKVNLRNNSDILNIDNNVKLGSKYLQLMLERYKNLVVATAAYNAGPGRINKWLPNYDIAADIWVELIPFKDTREYVQNVMTYTVIYQKLLGKNHYLNMPIIKKI